MAEALLTPPVHRPSGTVMTIYTIFAGLSGNICGNLLHMRGSSAAYFCELLTYRGYRR
jgi:hypothetical protein